MRRPAEYAYTFAQAAQASLSSESKLTAAPRVITLLGELRPTPARDDGNDIPGGGLVENQQRGCPSSASPIKMLLRCPPERVGYVFSLPRSFPTIQSLLAAAARASVGKVFQSAKS